MTLRFLLHVLFLAGFSPAPQEQLSYDPDEDYRSLPPTAREVWTGLEGVDIAAAVALARDIVAGRVSGAEYVEEDEPRCEVHVWTGEEHHLVVTDPAGGEVLRRDVVPRFPGEPVTTEWQELETGVRYADIVVGEGEYPRNSLARVQVHYDGYLANGSLFQTTRNDDEPSSFLLKATIPGWKDAILGMRRGGKRKVIIPPDQAYGPRGRPPFVPPNATLIFDLELVGLPRR